MRYRTQAVQSAGSHESLPRLLGHHPLLAHRGGGGTHSIHIDSDTTACTLPCRKPSHPDGLSLSRKDSAQRGPARAAHQTGQLDVGGERQKFISAAALQASPACKFERIDISAPASPLDRIQFVWLKTTQSRPNCMLLDVHPTPESLGLPTASISNVRILAASADLSLTFTGNAG
jgi:hypothetical protein